MGGVRSVRSPTGGGLLSKKVRLAEPAVLALVALVNLALLIEVILRQEDPGLTVSLRLAQSIFLVATVVTGVVVATAMLGRRRAGTTPATGATAWRKAVYWSLFPTIVMAGVVWMLWNYRIDGVLTWPDTEDYAQVASWTVLSPAFWAGGNTGAAAAVQDVRPQLGGVRRSALC
jgi:hypothetical protein